MNLRLKSNQNANVVREADTVIAEPDRIKLSEHDYMRVLALLENPPAPNARLRAAAKALPRSV